MLNMKKGLALVLAAATAFTFAPVSTLGLTGVVTVQAQELTKDTNSNTYSGEVTYNLPTNNGHDVYTVLVNGKYYTSSDSTKTTGDNNYFEWDAYKGETKAELGFGKNQSGKLCYNSDTDELTSIKVTFTKFKSDSKPTVSLVKLATLTEDSSAKNSADFKKQLETDAKSIEDATTGENATEVTAETLGKASATDGQTLTVAEGQNDTLTAEIAKGQQDAVTNPSNDLKDDASVVTASTKIADQNSVGTITLTSDGHDYNDYTLNMKDFNASDSAAISWTNTDVISVTRSTTENPKLTSSEDLQYAKGTTFRIRGLKKGTSQITVSWGQSRSKQITWNVVVNDPSENPWASVDSSKVIRQDSDGTKYVHTDDGTTANATTITGTGYLNNHGGNWDITSVSSSHPDVVKPVVKANGETDITAADFDEADGEGAPSFKVNFLKPGDSTVSITYKVKIADDSKKTTYGSFNDGDSFTVNLKFVVIAADSTFKAGDTAITKNNYTENAPQIVETVYLTEKDSSKSLHLSLSDKQEKDEQIKFEGVALNTDTNGHKTVAKTGNDAFKANTGSTYANTDLNLDTTGEGTVTATANALNSTENYYDVLVTNGLSAEKAKSGIIRVITIRNEKKFTKATVKYQNAGGDQTAEAEASYNADGSVKDGTKSVGLTLSTTDLKEVPFVASQTNGKTVDVKVNDTSKVEYDASSQTLKAKAVGSAIVTVTAKSDTTYYGNATITFSVDVTDQYVVNAITVKNADPIQLTKNHNTETIEASCPGKNTLSYRLVTPAAGNAWAATQNSSVSVDATTGKLTYTGVGEGTVTVEISGTANTVALAPIPKYVTVNYTDSKAASAFDVTSKKAVNLEVGGTSAITVANVTTGASVTYTSSDDSIASVSGGTIKANEVGTAIVYVTDPGDANTLAKTVQIIVNVKAAPVVVEAPKAVTGIKVKNAKGAKVSVTWAAQDKTVLYRIYKKVGNGSWKAKNVTNAKATLSVKKGAKVTVKVKAFRRDANGTAVWGPNATKAKAFKTDKK